MMYNSKVKKVDFFVKNKEDEKNANIHIGRKERNRKEFSCNGFMPERKY